MINVDPSNAAQRDAWDGDQGEFWTVRADRFNDGVQSYRAELLTAAAVQENSDVLDIGCGSGQTTREAGRRAPAGTSVGVDLSASMLHLARSLTASENLTNVTFIHADAQVYPFVPESFDIAISRHGAMFFGDPQAAFVNIRRALRPGGRLVLLTWRPSEENEWTRSFHAAFSLPVGSPSGHGPRPGSLTDRQQINDLLTSVGFSDVRVTGLDRPMYFGRDVEDASEFIAGKFDWATAEMDESEKEQALSALRADMAQHLTEDGVIYQSAAWLIQARVG